MNTNAPSSADEIIVRHPRRFSEGMERVPVDPATLRVGRYSDGLAPALTITPDLIGSYADGLVARPDASAVLRVGSFGDCDKPKARRRRTRPRAEAAPVRA
jgi:hypothetical protein